MNKETPVGGTPPQIWKKFTHGAKGEMWAGLVRDQVRIARLCRQVEKLNWMVEYMGLCNIYDQPESNSMLVTVEGAEEAWLER